MRSCTIPKYQKNFWYILSHLIKIFTLRSATKKEGSEYWLSNFEVLKTGDQPDEYLCQKPSSWK